MEMLMFRRPIADTNKDDIQEEVFLPMRPQDHPFSDLNEG
jgi:hypothetical protein